MNSAAARCKTETHKVHCVDHNIVTYQAIFEDRLETTIRADIGADASIIDRVTFNQIINYGSSATCNALLRPQIFNMAATLE